MQCWKRREEVCRREKQVENLPERDESKGGSTASCGEDQHSGDAIMKKMQYPRMPRYTPPRPMRVPKNAMNKTVNTVANAAVGIAAIGVLGSMTTGVVGALKP
ncbi:MAG: hypothetical protein PHT77_05605 [Bacteroidales bacterium]|nr:hypothetical protein [Bacteroidales bacterium]